MVFRECDIRNKISPFWQGENIAFRYKQAVGILHSDIADAKILSEAAL